MDRTALNRIAPTLAALAATLAFGLACASVSADAPARKDIVISFDNAKVMPSTAKVLEGGSVAFSNLSDRWGKVRLPMADKTKFECKELRPDFFKTDTAIESLPFAGNSTKIVLPCSLKKGKYSFKIDMFGRKQDMDNPELTVDGVLLVE